MATATTTTRVNLRGGPGTTFPVLTVLNTGTTLTVLNEKEGWLEVEAAGQRGFVSAGFVTREGQGVAPGLMAAPDEHEGGRFAGVQLSPPPEQCIQLGAGASSGDKLVANTWNRCGGLLGAVSEHLKLDAGAAVSVFATESSGKAFGADGRMVIRFENHHFHRHWGKANKAIFDQHFRFNETKPWTGHEWRASAGEEFRPFHGSQQGEWAAFELARTFHDTAAKLCISMGGPQILGSNFAEAGFESVDQMFEAFSTSERRQIIAFFDFVQGPSTQSRKVLALQQQDFLKFASLYNGPGNAPEYGEKITRMFEAFNRLRPASVAAVSA